MRSTLAVLVSFFAATYAGNVCLAGQYKATGTIDSNNLIVFAAGSPCDDDRSIRLGENVDGICDDGELPVGFEICGQNANLVRLDSGPESAPGCQIGLEINGETYEGETWPFNPDDGNAHDGPCDATCGLTEGVDGFLHFIGVPMCD
jgi:hypothetical protein